MMAVVMRCTYSLCSIRENTEFGVWNGEYCTSSYIRRGYVGLGYDCVCDDDGVNGDIGDIGECDCGEFSSVRFRV